MSWQSGWFTWIVPSNPDLLNEDTVNHDDDDNGDDDNNF